MFIIFRFFLCIVLRTLHLYHCLNECWKICKCSHNLLFFKIPQMSSLVNYLRFTPLLIRSRGQVDLWGALLPKSYNEAYWLIRHHEICLYPTLDIDTVFCEHRHVTRNMYIGNSGQKSALLVWWPHLCTLHNAINSNLDRNFWQFMSFQMIRAVMPRVRRRRHLRRHKILERSKLQQSKPTRQTSVLAVMSILSPKMFSFSSVLSNQRSR